MKDLDRFGHQEMDILQLKEKAHWLHRQIYNTQCFRARDILEFELIRAELETRGIKVSLPPELKFSDEEGDYL